MGVEIHHIFEATNSEDTQYLMPHATHAMEKMFSLATSFEATSKHWNFTLATIVSKMS